MGRDNAFIQSTLLGEAAELAPIGVFVVDDTFAFIAVNRYGCEMFGYERDELLKMRVSDLAVRGREELEADYRTLMRDGILEVEAPVRLADGTIRTIRYRSYRSRIAGLDVLFGFADFIGP